MLGKASYHVRDGAQSSMSQRNTSQFHAESSGVGPYQAPDGQAQVLGT